MINQSVFYFVSLIVVLSLSFFAGSYFLEISGIQYVSEGGPAIYKIHLYSYLSIFIFLLHVFQTGFKKIAVNLKFFYKPWLLLLLSIVYLIVYGLFKFGTSGMAYVVDTLLVPVMLFPIMFIFNQKQYKLIAKFLFILLAVNSFAAIYEFISGFQIFSFEYEEHWIYFRSTAFLSHPLNNALIVSFLAIFLYKYRFINPVFLFLLTSLALFCFGARTATFIFVCLSLFELIKIYVAQYRRKRGFGFNEFLLLKIVVMGSVFILFYAIFYLNFGQRIFENLSLDNSARSRFDVFNVFQYLIFDEYLFGARPEFFDNIIFYTDNFVVENFVIGWFLFYGLVGSSFLIIAFYKFMFSIFSFSERPEKVAILAFLITSISNNSLATKTPALLFFLVAFVVSFQMREQFLEEKEIN